MFGGVRPGDPISQVRAGLADLRNLFVDDDAGFDAAAATAVGDTDVDDDNCEGLSSQSETRPDDEVLVVVPPPLFVGVFPFVMISLSESLLCIRW